MYMPDLCVAKALQMKHAKSTTDIVHGFNGWNGKLHDDVLPQKTGSVREEVTR